MTQSLADTHYQSAVQQRCQDTQELIRKQTWTFMQCTRKLPKFAEITQNNAIMPFKVIQGNQLWYQSKAHMRFPISD